jgi:hypothetical protein
LVVALAVFSAISLNAPAGAQLSQGPNVPGAAFDDVSFGTVAWTTPGNAVASDNAYAQAAPGGGDTHYLSTNNFGFSIPAAAVIDGIEVNIERHSALGTIKDARLRIVKGGLVGGTERGDLVSTWPMTDAVKTYGSSGDLWGETWTPSDINANDFGVVLSVTDSGDAALVDQITIEVFFSLCAPAPIGGCDNAGKTLFLVKDKTDDSKDKILFKFIKGPATSQADFADPISTASYALCIYENGALNSSAVVPASATLWSKIGTKGFKYKDKSGTAAGIQKIILKGSTDAKTKIIVKGKGAALPDPNPDLTLPVQVQVINGDNSSHCWDATYNSAIKNETGLFKAKTP